MSSDDEFHALIVEKDGLEAEVAVLTGQNDVIRKDNLRLICDAEKLRAQLAGIAFYVATFHDSRCDTCPIMHHEVHGHVCTLEDEGECWFKQLDDMVKKGAAPNTIVETDGLEAENLQIKAQLADIARLWGDEIHYMIRPDSDSKAEFARDDKFLKEFAALIEKGAAPAAPNAPLLHADVTREASSSVTQTLAGDSNPVGSGVATGGGGKAGDTCECGHTDIVHDVSGCKICRREGRVCTRFDQWRRGG